MKNWIVLPNHDEYLAAKNAFQLSHGWTQPDMIQTNNNTSTSEDGLFDTARQLFSAGRSHAAAVICKKLLHVHSEHGNALHLLGIVEQQSGNFLVAKCLFQKLLKVDPNNFTAWSNYGVVSRSLGDLEHARECFENALKICPEYADAWNNLGALFEVMDTAKAEDCFKRALELAPSSVDTCNNLALICKKSKRFSDAASWYSRSLSMNKSQPDIWCHLAEVLEETSSLEEIRAAYRSSLALRQDDGVSLKLATLLPVVLPSYSAIGPVREELWHNLELLKHQGLIIENPLKSFRTLFYLAYQGENDRKFHEMLADIYRAASQGLSWNAPHIERKITTNERVRVGFISRFFYQHTIAKLNIGMIEKLDRSRFHISVFLINSGNSDEMTHRFAATADSFAVLDGGLAQMRNQVAAAELDILLYTDIGMEPYSYFLAFSRLARVQCATWGHPATTGISTIDYFISHEDCETEESRTAYSEKLFCLSSAAACACYAYPSLPHTGRTLEYYGIDSGQNVYYCPQPPFKMHPDFDILLKGILERDPNGLVVLLRGVVPESEMLLRQRLSETMPACMDRLLFLNPLPFDDYIRMLELADVILDTPHFSGGSSSVEALAVGAAVVTLPSRYLKGRLTYAWYRRLGIDDCIAYNADDYIRIAVRIGTDRKVRENLQWRIKEASHLIFDDKQALKELENFFQKVSQS